MEKIKDFTFLFDTLFENVSDRLFHAPKPPEDGPRIELKEEMFSEDTWQLIDGYLCQCNTEEGGLGSTGRAWLTV